MPYKNMTVVQVDDDPDDVFMVKMCLKGIGFEGAYHHFETGPDLMAWLATCQSSELPHLMFCDMNLAAGQTGLDVLGQVRSCDAYRHIPVLILSGSNSKRDLHNSLQAGCNGYLVKSGDIEGFQETCNAFLTAWALTMRQRYV